MNILQVLRGRFDAVLSPLVDETAPLLEMIRPTNDPKFGDYQANCAMPLGKKLGKNPREIAAEIVEKIDLSDMCEPLEIAGPGFINIKLKDAWIEAQLAAAVTDERIGVPLVEAPKKYVLDFSSPNVAKPMHVGHIRSTVIGDSLAKTLRFLGHEVITDNHLGDWGTQFGMIIYGFKHFRNNEAYHESPVAELSRLYREVRKIIDYIDGQKSLPARKSKLMEMAAEIEERKAMPPTGDKAADKKATKELEKLQRQAEDASKELVKDEAKLSALAADPEFAKIAAEHSDIGTAVLNETAKLHADDEENLALWHEFLPKCREDIQRIYQRLDVTFDYELGESFYHNQLGPVVNDFIEKGFAEESEGALCVFLDGFKAPMIIRKKDGAFLYATTDLATIEYRMREWKPDAILYVVDFRQGEHFDKLFAAAKKWGYADIELKHVSFGTVMGEDGKPYKTRSGDTVGLEGLLDEAVSRADKIVRENDKDGQLSEEQYADVAQRVGIGGLKYGDLSQNRETDYVFSYDKMLALNGNTATYMQYAYARVQSIFRRGEVDIAALRTSGAKIGVSSPAERALAMKVLRLPEALQDTIADYRPNQLTSYLFEELAKSYSTFFEQCPVLKAETDEQKQSRLLLCDLTARVIQQGLALLGISTVDKM
ncbi:arginine--tRNA ligase [Blastopirellula sp. JC732]|uniref:Arginine--tRNA ligase n=1 Tax=Blastopirellula sediminis TaxID=2894196 RepID=A0A9X1MMZ1_9BACT|nr:arginine--tRNA ligase [Blastopirellula sediminis]MCC9606954.1 arginine--tRNA ligase [Blastopirellula sediminis]MCC9629751.1 arginine--tRNA ligase [Blastopirellula sediminis]